MEIHWRNPGALKDEERETAEHRLHKLAGDHHDVVDVWIDVADEHHHRKGTGNVTIRGDVRRAALIAIGNAEDASMSLRAALRAFEKQLHKLRDRRSARPHARAAGAR